MRTTGLGGDSEVHLLDGLDGGLRLGPKRLLPVSLLAMDHPTLVHRALDAALAAEAPPDGAGRFVVPLFTTLPAGLDPRETAVAQRLTGGPLKLSDALRARTESPALARLVARGVVMLAGLTPSDAAHQVGKLADWDAGAAQKALILFGRKRAGRGERIAADAGQMAQAIIDQLTAQTVDCLLEAAFAEEERDFGAVPETLTRHGLTRAGLDRHAGIIVTHLTLGVPVIGLGASAPAYYRAVGDRLGARMILPALACAALQSALTTEAAAKARDAGVAEIRLSVDRDINQVEVEGQMMFIEARLRVTAQGRPRIATG